MFRIGLLESDLHRAFFVKPDTSENALKFLDKVCYYVMPRHKSDEWQGYEIDKRILSSVITILEIKFGLVNEGEL